MEMWKNGVIDANTAMELLGREAQQGGGSSDKAKPAPTPADTSSGKPESKKRSISDVEPDADGDDQSLDDFLDQAEKTRKETQLKYGLFL